MRSAYALLGAWSPDRFGPFPTVKFKVDILFFRRGECQQYTGTHTHGRTDIARSNQKLTLAKYML